MPMLLLHNILVYWVLDANMLYILEFYFGMREEVSTVFSSLGIFKVSVRVCIWIVSAQSVECRPPLNVRFIISPLNWLIWISIEYERKI